MVAGKLATEESLADCGKLQHVSVKFKRGGKDARTLPRINWDTSRLPPPHFFSQAISQSVVSSTLPLHRPGKCQQSGLLPLHLSTLSATTFLHVG